MGESAISNRLLEKNIEELLADFESRKKQRDLTCEPIGIQAYYAALENNNHELFLKTATALTHYFIEISSEFEKAVHYLKETIQYLHAKSDFEEESEFYRRLALSYDYQGEMVAAKENYDSSIKLLENRTDLTEKGFLTLARSLFNESIIYNRLGLVTLANDYLNKSSEYFFKANYIPGIIRCHISFGVQAYDEKKYGKGA